MILSANQVLEYGLDNLHLKSDLWSNDRKILEFHAHYGSAPLDLADQWYDLMQDQNMPGDLKLTKKEKSEKGLKRYFAAHFFLWAYPKNAKMLASRFRICHHYCTGKELWKWVKRIAALKPKKIVWDENIEGKIFLITVDGTDFKVHETRHPTLPRDNGMCSHKMKHAAAKYEVALSVHEPKCVHIAGPFKGGVHDLEMFRRGGLKAKMEALKAKLRIAGKPFKICTIADRGYKSKDEAERDLFSLPNHYDSKELSNFKSRARLRQETFNARLKCFNALSSPFRHGFNNHKHVFEAIVVTVQYQMDNGSRIFAV
jgi:hypothetical protein